ncbi:MAG: hypothetical protein JSS66_06535 [Armatimonadetes bacterium]|nr:hypothetical protein [Armatimonadota bacterium]
MGNERNHAAKHHLGRIFDSTTSQAVKNIDSGLQWHSETAAVNHINALDVRLRQAGNNDEEIASLLRDQIENCARLLVMMQRRTGNFNL